MNKRWNRVFGVKTKNYPQDDLIFWRSLEHPIAEDTPVLLFYDKGHKDDIIYADSVISVDSLGLSSHDYLNVTCRINGKTYINTWNKWAYAYDWKSLYQLNTSQDVLFLCLVYNSDYSIHSLQQFNGSYNHSQSGYDISGGEDNGFVTICWKER